MSVYKKIKTKRYKKDYEKLVKQKINVIIIDNLVDELANKNFTHAYKNHKLEPKSKNVWECHVGSAVSDLLLVYKYEENELKLLLLRTGSHSDILEEYDDSVDGLEIFM